MICGGKLRFYPRSPHARRLFLEKTHRRLLVLVLSKEHAATRVPSQADGSLWNLFRIFVDTHRQYQWHSMPAGHAAQGIPKIDAPRWNFCSSGRDAHSKVDLHNLQGHIAHKKQITKNCYATDHVITYKPWFNKKKYMNLISMLNLSRRTSMFSTLTYSMLIVIIIDGIYCIWVTSLL